MAKRRIAPVQPLVRADDRDGSANTAGQRIDWSRRGQLTSFAMTVAALVYVAHYPHDSVEVLQGTARYLIAWVLLASGIAVISYSAVQRIDRWIDGLCIGFALCMTFSLVLQVGSVNLRLGANELGWWWAMAALIPLVRRIAVDKEMSWWLFRIVLAVTVGQAVMGWHQKLIDLPNLIAEYHENPDKMLRNFQIPTDQLSAMRVRFVNRLFDSGPTGTFALTNSLAALLCGGIVALLACLLQGSKQWRWRWIVWGLAVGVVATILLATASRSAMVALLIVGGLIAGQRVLQSRGMSWLRRHPAVLVSLAMATLCMFALAIYGFRGSEFIGQAPASLAIRINYWRACIAMLTQHPWFGIGPGQFRLVYEQYRLPESNEQIADPHQFLLQVAAAGGLVTLALFIAILGWLFWQSIRSNRHTDHEALPHSELAVVTEPSTHRSTVDIVAWTALGLSLALAWLIGLATDQLPAFQSLLVGTLAAGLFSALTAWRPRHNAEAKSHCLNWFRQAAGWASIAVLVDLLASGGITVPGISVALWCWVGIAVPVCWSTPRMQLQTQALGEDAINTPPSTSKPVVMASQSFVAESWFNRWFNRALGLFLVTALWVWYLIGIRPVEQANLVYNQYMNQAARRITPAAAETLEGCLAADPWNAEYALELAAVYQQLGAVSPQSAEKWDRRWQEAEQRAVALAGQDAVAMLRLGDQRLERFQQSGDRDMLQSASQWYEQATLRSPSHETYLAQWAETLRALGDPRAQEVALRALKLSEAGGYYERTFPFTIIRPAIQMGPRSPAGRSGSRSDHRNEQQQLQPADKVLAPLLPAKQACYLPDGPHRQTAIG